MAELVVKDLGRLKAQDALDRMNGLPCLTFLDSAMRHERLGRYSFIAADPFGTFRVDDGVPYWNGGRMGGPPLEGLRLLLRQFPLATPADLPPFIGGAAGFIAYEFARSLERLPPVAASGLPDAMLHFYDLVVAFDHLKDRAWLLSSGWPEAEGAARAARAEQRAQSLLARLSSTPQTNMTGDLPSFAWASSVQRADFEAAVQRTIDYVLAGDIFQANISQRFTAGLDPGVSPYGLYLRLRDLNPATFAAWLDYGTLQIASCSPERFVEVVGDRVETRPIKGTAPRSDDQEEDRRLVSALLGSEKERAENVMIVDLLRNDLSRVCRPQTVEVPALCAVESYAGLHHLVSTVTGTLQQGKGPVDLLAAVFPGGSITGAPKVRAMEIITALEQAPRGVYCGSIGYIGFDGRMDTNIAIRTLTFLDGKVSFNVGGGITALSDPAAEYEETLVKAARIFAALKSRCA